MRDAVGGVFTTNFLLVFIFIYIAVTAVSLNYAKAFKVKNAMIDFVEQHEVTDLDDFFGPSSKEEKRTKIDEILQVENINIKCYNHIKANHKILSLQI